MSTVTDVPEIPTERMIINMGPAHPITHGTLRIQCELDGEVVVKSACEIGYLHRGFEKEAEHVYYQFVIPYAERMNYMGPVHNSNAWCHAVEELVGISDKIPPRANALRVITSELGRIIDHCVCLGANLVDLGALTNFWYLYGYREKVYDLYDELCGARMMVNYPRIGGVSMDAPDGWFETVLKTVGELKEVIGDVKGLVAKNRIFLERTQGIGVISLDEAISHSFTGPCLRACGLGHDLRKAQPYWGYEQYDFDIPTYEEGDTWARMMIRFDEMFQSARIVEQAIARMPEGPFILDDPRFVLPPKDEVYNTMEGLINHFKLVMHGVQPERGEIYSATEGGNGEVGYYIISDGSARPWRVRVRPPCFANYTAFPKMLNGCNLADISAVLGSINIIAGELDR